jgi:cytochrome c
MEKSGESPGRRQKAEIRGFMIRLSALPVAGITRAKLCGAHSRDGWRAAVAVLALAMAVLSYRPATAQLELRGHGGPVRAVTISPDGKMALSGSFDYSVIYWQLSGGKPRIAARLEGHDAAVNAAVFTPDGKRALSGSDDGTIGLWDLKTGKLEHRFNGHKAKVVNLALSPDGRFAASAAWDRTIRVWDLRARRLVATLKGHRGNVNAVTFAADGKTLYSAGYDGTIRQWAIKDGGFGEPIVKFGWGVNVLARLPGSDWLIYGTLDGTVEVFDPKSGQVKKRLAKHGGPVLSLALSGRHKLVATGGGDGKIFVFAADNWRFVKQHHNPSSPVWSMGFTGNGHGIYYAGLDDFVIHWEVRPGKPFEEVKSKFPRRFQVKKNMVPGARHFARKCSICHTLTPDGGNRAGPTLYNLFGRKAGSVKGYVYSDALKSADIVWNEQTIGRLFNEGPDRYTPGSKMPLQRIQSDKERSELIVYLKRATRGGKNGTK